MLDPGEDERLLDIGTGTAALLRELARRRDRPARAVGLDRSPAMLARAGPIPAGWELLRGDARRLPFESGSFDVATASYLLHVVTADARAAILGEIHRVLGAGGRVGMITVAPPRSRVGLALSRPVRAAAARSDGALAGLRPLDPGPLLREAGFAATGRRRVLRGYPSLCVTALRPR